MVRYISNEHTGQKIYFQFLSCIFYFLKENYDSFIFEGKDKEDCLFYKGNKCIAIGESKDVSQDKWTLRSLFYHGDRYGPITQLLLRKTSNEKLIFFSNKPLHAVISEKSGQLDLSNMTDNESSNIIDQTNSILRSHNNNKKINDTDLEYIKPIFRKKVKIFLPYTNYQKALGT